MRFGVVGPQKRAEHRTPPGPGKGWGSRAPTLEGPLLLVLVETSPREQPGAQAYGGPASRHPPAPHDSLQRSVQRRSGRSPARDVYSLKKTVTGFRFLFISARVLLQERETTLMILSKKELRQEMKGCDFLARVGGAGVGRACGAMPGTAPGAAGRRWASRHPGGGSGGHRGCLCACLLTPQRGPTGPGTLLSDKPPQLCRERVVAWIRELGWQNRACAGAGAPR